MWWGGPRTPTRWRGCGRRTTRSRRAQPVRLAKRTSNLFRPGRRVDAPGLDVSGLDGVISSTSTPTARHRRRAGHVHLRGPRRRDAAARADPARRAAAARRSPSAARSPGSASSRRRSATGCRTSRCWRWTSSPATASVVTAPRPATDLFDAFPNSYGSPRLRHPAADRARAGAGRTSTLRHVRFDDLDALAKTDRR